MSIGISFHYYLKWPGNINKISLDSAWELLQVPKRKRPKIGITMWEGY
jgi:hypothetical protein